MKTFFFCIVTLTITFHISAQNNWIKERRGSYSIEHPKTWTVRTSEKPSELDMAGPTPDFNGSNKHLATTLFISAEPSRFVTIDSATNDYKSRLLGTEFLKNIIIQKENKIKLNGIDAVDITFRANVQHFSTACRIIILQHKNVYYEISVTYDTELSKKLVKEAYKVIESFEINP